jgi:glycosyltransferase involved in cell wall biosynthesis
MSERTGTILDYVGHRAEAEASADGKPLFKEGTASEHERGIFYRAPWEPVHDGFAKHSRRSALALAQTGVPVHLRSYFQRIHTGEDSDAFRAIEQQLRPLIRASISRPWVEIYQLVPTDQNLYRHTTMSADQTRFMKQEVFDLVNRHRILYTVWEREPIPRGSVEALKRVGQCWTACEANRDMLERAGVPASQLRLVPIPFFPDDPHLALAGRPRRPGTTRFYHIGKWEPRKAQDKIIEAFLSAFRPGKAQLVLKTSELRKAIEGYPRTPLDAIHRALLVPAVRANGWTATNWPAGIKLFTARLPDEALVNMHDFGDVYVTLSRGEGFDMPAFDAKLAGNLIVYTPSGGPQDFAGAKDVRVPAPGRVPAHSLYQWNPEATYLSFDVADAAAAMQTAFERVQTHDRQPDVDLSRFRAEHVGRQMLGFIEEVVGQKVM